MLELMLMLMMMLMMLLMMMLMMLIMMMIFKEHLRKYFLCGIFDVLLSIMKVLEGRHMLCYLIELSLPHPPAERGWIVFIFYILHFVISFVRRFLCNHVHLMTFLS